MEKMLDLFDENQTIKDDPDATEFQLNSATIKFENVSFSYDGKVPVLKNISFTIPAGKTYALVGSSGGGKSSCLRVFFSLI
jgi:ABC-type transport system involved in Fe-S cluster assembly fused permease/ATPase subunit